MKKTSKKITGKTKLSDIMQTNPEAAGALFESGMGCMGCPMAMQETIEQGCLAHGMTKKQMDELIKKINKEKK
jgi:hybrid cluster-associated redox disulfide protein